MKNKILKIEYKNLNELQAYDKNSRIHSAKQLKKIAKSLEHFGFINPILINSKNVIVAGHGRYEAAKMLNLSKVPTILIDDLSEEDFKAYVIADNKLAEDASWDFEILKDEFKDLFTANYDFDLSSTGFDIPEIDFILEDKKIKNKIDVPPNDFDVEKLVKFGDLWQLGNHYMLCGDSRDEDSYKCLLGDNMADMIFTDPPYNVRINGHVIKDKNKHKEFVMASGEMSKKDFMQFLVYTLGRAAKYSREGSIHFVCMDWRHIYEIMRVGNKIYSEFKNLCVWNKGKGGMGSLYRSQHELIFVFKKGDKQHVNNIELGKHGRYRTNIWDYAVASNELHPTCKPVDLVMDAIRDCSNMNNIILDPFAGSGSTLLAAERTKRKAYVIEYEPHYCDVIIHRYKKLTNNKISLIKRKGQNNG